MPRGRRASVPPSIIAPQLSTSVRSRTLVDRGGSQQSLSCLFVVLTDVPAVMVDFGTPQQRPLTDVTPAELAQHPFPAGSMGPKIEAVYQFVTTTGNRAAVGSLDEVAAVVAGTAGTQVCREPSTAQGDAGRPVV